VRAAEKDFGRMRIIVVGNEKGGSGKSTAAVHIALGLLVTGRRVATLDVDSRQQTFTRFLSNRAQYAETHDLDLLLPDHRILAPADLNDKAAAEEETERRLDATIAELEASADYLVIDGPGSDTVLSRHAHSHADLLITPVNDSFVDLDVLADIDSESFRVMRPSRYCAMVFDQKKKRAARDGGSIDWVVMRNRLAHLNARNKQRVEAALDALAPRVGFRVLPGFAERVIFRELFPRGLTVLDLGAAGIRMTMSHVGARNEVRNLLGAVVRRTASGPRQAAARPRAAELGQANLSR
jgi:chromosome partitioning protein